MGWSELASLGGPQKYPTRQSGQVGLGEHPANQRAETGALGYLARNITFNGDIDIPVLTLHTTGDELVPVQNEQPYWAIAHRGDDASLLRREFVHRGGHCNFTIAEDLAGLQLLTSRIDFGVWPDSSPDDLNAAAAAFGSRYNKLPQPPPQPVLQPAFVEYKPAPFLRPFNARDVSASDVGTSGIK